MNIVPKLLHNSVAL